MEILVLFSCSFDVKECCFGGDRERTTNTTVVAKCRMQQEVTLSTSCGPGSKNFSVELEGKGEYAKVPI